MSGVRVDAEVRVKNKMQLFFASSSLELSNDIARGSAITSLLGVDDKMPCGRLMLSSGDVSTDNRRMTMRVWIIGDKRYGDSGEEQWEVEWQTKHPEYDSMPQAERECFDPAWHPFHCKTFPIAPASNRTEQEVNREKAKAAAIEYARKVADESFWGVADVTLQQLDQVESRSYDWKNVRSESVEGIDACA